jgi:NAD(P)-dependent dehydrogenase (short-subunit alcohol dehydrogenase family)
VSVAGKTAIVTGAATGIGAATATLLAARGARVLAAGLQPEALRETVAAIEAAGGEALAIEADVSDPEQIEAVAARAEEAFGGTDILVNNAAIYPLGPWYEADAAEWDAVFATNVRGAFLLARAVRPQMLARGGGSIVNVASVMGLRSIGQIPDAAYVASKAGIIGLTRELASQWGRYGIRVNAVAPGFFPSEMTAELGDDPEAFPPFLLERTPLGRGGRAGELDEAVLFLLGPGSSFVTGHVLSVDGGMAVR